ncbi:SIS domain-containing protein [uncultured Zoogloea sp.]|uniref:SIS domain-containing protein n=1 Tax=uncultured Zoogloea sp. TaxID=160237 RepID=UPI00260F56C4|nr:SIS domain-containing protein [uncultured Zoogloea sp.]
MGAMESVVMASLREARQALDAMLDSPAVVAAVARAGSALAKALDAGGRVYSCGNGGSMCDAMHFAEELSGRYRQDRPALGAAAISDVGHLTCVGNDYGYDRVFARYVEGHGRAGDFLLAISTSGSSPSVLNAVAAARARGMQVIGLHGRPGSPLAQICDFDICTPAGAFADRVQECHIKVIHILIEIVERQLFPQNYA